MVADVLHDVGTWTQHGGTLIVPRRKALPGGVALHLPPDAHQVQTQDLCDGVLVVAALQQAGHQVREVADILQADRQRVADAVEIGTQASVIEASP